MEDWADRRRKSTPISEQHTEHEVLYLGFGVGYNMPSAIMYLFIMITCENKQALSRPK
ncbi:MAG: hypothetical protein PHT00_01540 [Candidatus Methanomethylophilus sp.]|nr:hypothetical protein [Methanomethylophilus sp.]MDD4222259.1 hypothetical protein [Methanomethylophilus sp.]MDD4668687.1 hypothetical protein [Methanomethylophilus sp.]